MSKWRNEVEAAVHPVVHDMSSVEPALIMKVSLKLIVNVLDDGLKADIINGNRNRNNNTNNYVNTLLQELLSVSDRVGKSKSCSHV